MKLSQPLKVPENERQMIQDLELLMDQPSYKELRPCQGCEKPCTCSQSFSCTCMCQPECGFAPLQMSSEPGQYPIEPKIIFLVFGFNCLRICTPYWSCEGHLFTDGKLFRVPQVWFYSQSTLYPKIINEYIHNLKIRKAINYPWHICLTFSENKLETGFSLEPDLKYMVNPDLLIMQKDVKVIAEHFVDGVKKLAGEYLSQYRPSSR